MTYGSNTDATESISKYDLFINDKFGRSTGPDRITVKTPYDGTVWATVPDGTAADIDEAVSAARAAFEESWRDTATSDRARILHEIADTLDTNDDELGELETRQNGKLLRK